MAHLSVEDGAHTPPDWNSACPPITDCFTTQLRNAMPFFSLGFTAVLQCMGAGRGVAGYRVVATGCIEVP